MGFAAAVLKAVPSLETSFDYNRAFARNLGLIATDLLPPAKHGLARLAMGLAGRQPRLTRGLPL